MEKFITLQYMAIKRVPDCVMDGPEENSILLKKIISNYLKNFSYLKIISYQVSHNSYNHESM